MWSLLGKADNNWTQLASARLPVTPGTRYHLRVTAIGPAIAVYVDDLSTPKLSVTDTSHAGGATGVRVFRAAASFDNIAVDRPDGS